MEETHCFQVHRICDCKLVNDTRKARLLQMLTREGRRRQLSAAEQREGPRRDQRNRGTLDH